MSKNQRPGSRRRIGRDRHISIRSARRQEPDVGKIARAVVSLALAQAEAQAQAEAERRAREAPGGGPPAGNSEENRGD